MLHMDARLKSCQPTLPAFLVGSSLKQYVNIVREKKQIGTLQSDAQFHLMEAWWRGTKTWMLSLCNRAGCHESLVGKLFPTATRLGVCEEIKSTRLPAASTW